MNQAIQGPVAGFQTFLQKHQIHAAVVKYPSTEYLPAPFAVYFPRKDWALVYWDDVVLIFVQRLPEFSAVIQQYEFRYSEPDDNPAYWRANVWAKAPYPVQMLTQQEFVRAVGEHPTSRRAQAWLREVS